MNNLNNKLILGGAVAIVALIGVLVFLPRESPQQERDPARIAQQRDEGRTTPPPGGTLAPPTTREGDLSLDTPRPTPTPQPIVTPAPTEQPDDESTEIVNRVPEGEATSVTADHQGSAESLDVASRPDRPRTRPDGSPMDDEVGYDIPPPAVPLDAGNFMGNYRPSNVGRAGPIGGTPSPDTNNGQNPNDRDVSRDPSQPTPTPARTPRPTPTPSPTPDPGRASIYLDPAVITVTEGDYFTLDLYANSPEKAVGGYTTFVMYLPIEIEIVQIREGRDPFLGYPMVAQNNPETGVLILAGIHARSMSQPVGEIHLASIDFEALRPGTVQVNLAESDVANTDAQEMILTRESGTRVTVQPFDAVD